MESDSLIHHVIEVVGKVQGVFFRASTKEIAEKLGVKGTVQNLSNGSVLIHAEGTVEQVNSLERWCESGGPEYAQVDQIIVKESEPAGFNKFEIIR